MSFVELAALLPLLLLAATIVIALLSAAFFKHSNATYRITLIGLVISFASLFFHSGQLHQSSLLDMDTYSSYYMGLFYISAFVVAVFSRDYFHARKIEYPCEYYLVLLLATLGAAVLSGSSHFATFFLGLEILSVSLYALIAYRREDLRSLEAGTKYLVLAGTSSAFLLFGIALIFASLGVMDFYGIKKGLVENHSSPTLTFIGIALIFTGVGFKLSLAPFHLWAPDIYEGAPAPVTGFIATISKGAVFALLLRIFETGRMVDSAPLFRLLSILAIASMFIGNLTALRQNNVKRLLAYSSIAHLGYLLIAILAGTELGRSAAAYYLAAYFMTSLIAFGIVSLLSTLEREADQLSDFQGLFWKRPILALLFSTSVLSLAGIPLTAGFVGKFYLVSTGVSRSLWILVIALIINSAIGLYYYLRIIAAMFTSPEAVFKSEPSVLRPASVSTLMILSVFLIALGVYPGLALQMIQNTASITGIH